VAALTRRRSSIVSSLISVSAPACRTRFPLRSVDDNAVDAC
jgi:hypothetical protein